MKSLALGISFLTNLWHGEPSSEVLSGHDIQGSFCYYDVQDPISNPMSYGLNSMKTYATGHFIEDYGDRIVCAYIDNEVKKDNPIHYYRTVSKEKPHGIVCPSFVEKSDHISFWKMEKKRCIYSFYDLEKNVEEDKYITAYPPDDFWWAFSDYSVLGLQALGSNKGTIKVVNIYNKTEESFKDPSFEEINGLDITESPSCIAYDFSKGVVKEWDIPRMSSRMILRHPEVRDVKMVENNVLLSLSNKEIRLWDMRKAQIVQSLYVDDKNGEYSAVTTQLPHNNYALALSSRTKAIFSLFDRRNNCCQELTTITLGKNDRIGHIYIGYMQQKNCLLTGLTYGEGGPLIKVIIPLSKKIK